MLGKSRVSYVWVSWDTHNKHKKTCIHCMRHEGVEYVGFYEHLHLGEWG